MNKTVLIGLEIHAQMKTVSKMFSSAPSSFGEEPNTSTSSLDFALPGTMPSVNKQAVINAIRMCHALNMSIDDELLFERKNYFYHDLAKGFQITQKNRPIGTNGFLLINGKKISILELHLEEDTCKQVLFEDYLLLDYNRSGIPLLEIVSGTDISNGQEARQYIEKIRSILMFLNISDGKMEEGSLRVDVNVSIKGNPRVEIKNINTLKNVENAIDYEIERQQKLICSGDSVIQETRRYDEDNKMTVSMREKTDSIEYRYCVEINIPPIKLTSEFINEAIDSSPELAEERMNRYIKMGLDENSASQIVASVDKADYFEKLLQEGINIRLAANWMNVEMQTISKKDKIKDGAFPLEAKELATLLRLIQEGKIPHTIGKEIFFSAIEKGEDIKDVIARYDLSIIDNEDDIKTIIAEIIDNNPQLVDDYKNGKNRVVSYIVGKTMKKTSGQVNPGLTNKLVLEELKGR